jgi:hypothetical protein
VRLQSIQMQYTRLIERQTGFTARLLFAKTGCLMPLIV